MNSQIAMFLAALTFSIGALFQAPTAEAIQDSKQQAANHEGQSESTESTSAVKKFRESYEKPLVSVPKLERGWHPNSWSEIA